MGMDRAWLSSHLGPRDLFWTPEATIIILSVRNLEQWKPRIDVHKQPVPPKQVTLTVDPFFLAIVGGHVGLGGGVGRLPRSVGRVRGVGGFAGGVGGVGLGR